MKFALCLAAALSTIGAAAFATLSPATAATFGSLSLNSTSLVEEARYSRYYGRRCKTVRRVTYRNGVKRVVVRRVCRR